MLFVSIFMVILVLYGALIGTAAARLSVRLSPIKKSEWGDFSTTGTIFCGLVATLCTLSFFFKPPTDGSLVDFAQQAYVVVSLTSLVVPAAIAAYYIFKVSIELTVKAVDKIFDRG